MSGIVGYNLNPNGLSLYLDARNSNSYPGSGNTWYDLSLGSNNVSTALTTYNSASPASFSIPPGSSNYIEFTSSAITTSTCSIEIVFKPTSLPPIYQEFIWFTGSYGFQTQFSIILSMTNSVYFFTSSPYNIFYGVDYVIVPNQWQYWVFELYEGQTFSNNKMYLNGNQMTLSGNNIPSTSTTFNGGKGKIYGDASISCSMFRTYDRTLTQQEITNNYNYLKTVYNLL